MTSPLKVDSKVTSVLPKVRDSTLSLKRRVKRSQFHVTRFSFRAGVRANVEEYCLEAAGVKTDRTGLVEVTISY